MCHMVYNYLFNFLFNNFLLLKGSKYKINIPKFTLRKIRRNIFTMTEKDEKFSIGVGSSATHLTLSWEGLNVWATKKISNGYWRNSQHVNVQLLNNVSGSVESGSLTAIMGPSGAGKTTMLAAVSMRVRENMSGSLLLNGQPVSQKTLSEISGFVPQLDLMLETLTVREHMHFMAKMKMDRRTPTAVRKKRIAEVISEMAIAKCYHTKISGLSGGEKKRLSLAVQLVNNPPILFCDEPTTGLDSWAASSVVNRLRSLAEAGRAILCVLHQPTSDSFQLFHRLLLLSGGRVAYMGPINEASHFFISHNFRCPVGFNEAEYLVKVVSVEEKASILCSSWEKNKADGDIKFSEKTNFPEIVNEILKKNNQSRTKNEHFHNNTSIEKPGTFTQFFWLVWRSFMASKNDKSLVIALFFALMLEAVIVIIPYLNLFSEIDQKSIQNIQGFMYLMISQEIFMFVYSVFNNFPSEIGIFLREVANGLYSPGPYYLSKILLMIPVATILPLIYTSFIFWAVGLKGGFVTYILFTIPIIISANSANAYGSWLSTTFESIETASIVAVPVDLLAYMFSGNFFNLDSIPAYLRWIKYLSIFYYSSEAVSILQWEEIDHIKCDTRSGLPCIKTGLEVLDNFGFSKNNYGRDLLGLLGLYVGFHLLGFLSLLKRSRKQPVY